MTKEYVVSAETDDFQLRYYRTNVKNRDDSSENFFGVYVEKLTGERILEHANSGPITQDEIQANTTITLLAANTVTPMTLNEILDEMETLF